MTIKLPDLPAGACRNLTACSAIVDDDKPTLNWLRKHEGHKIAKVKTHGATIYVYAVFGRAFDKHCHLELATKDVFAPKDLPKETMSWGEIQKLFDPLMGKTIRIEAESVYAVAIDDLPAVIKTTRLFDSVQDGVGISMTGGKLSVKGAPIYAITWSLTDDPGEKKATIRLEARISTQLDETYLVRVFDLLQDGYKSFIESGVPRTNDKT